MRIVTHASIEISNFFCPFGLKYRISPNFYSITRAFACVASVRVGTLRRAMWRQLSRRAARAMPHGRRRARYARMLTATEHSSV